MGRTGLGRGSRDPGPAARDPGPAARDPGPETRDPDLPGFPAAGLATAVPNLFFSQLLPAIDSSEELVVSLYFFFAAAVLGRKRSPRFLTKAELAADSGLLRSLANLCGGRDGDALDRGLQAAVARGTLLHGSVEMGDRLEDAYLLNTPANRAALASGGVRERTPSPAPLPPAEPSTVPNVFALYEENIGSITPLIAEELKDAEERYPPEWVHEAFREAVSLNKRSWRYIQRILRRWETEGPDYEKAGRGTEAEWLERRYAAGKRQRVRG